MSTSRYQSSKPIIHPVLDVIPPTSDARICLPVLQKPNSRRDSRDDGRRNDEIRPIFLQSNYLPDASGSCLVQMGDTKVIARVMVPEDIRHPSAEQYADQAFLQCTVTQLLSDADYDDEDRTNGNVQNRRVRLPQSGVPPQYYQRVNQDLSMLLHNAILGSIIVKSLPKTQITLQVTILQQAGSVVTSCIAAASSALLSAGVPLYDTVAACEVAWCRNDPDQSIRLVIDPSSQELESSIASLWLAYMPSSKELTHMQQIGNISFEQTEEGLEMCLDGAQKVYQLTRNILRREIAHLQTK